MPPSQHLKKRILPDRMIADLAASGAIRLEPFAQDQIQPASLDLRLGASRLPGARELSSRAAKRQWPSGIAALKLHEIDLTEGAVLETGCVLYRAAGGKPGLAA